MPFPVLRPAIAAIAIAASLAISACGPDYSPNTYASNAVQQANKVEQGVVVGVRPVDVSASGTTGAVVGGAAGGIAGSTVPGGVTSAFGALGGTVLGGLVGTTIEHSTSDTTAFEYIVRKANKEMVSVTQRDPVALPVGQKVLVIAGNQARIVPDYTVPADAAKADPAPAETPEAMRKDTAATAPLPPPVAAAPLAPPPISASVTPGPLGVTAPTAPSAAVDPAAPATP